jgi:hypothetical protein
VGEIERILFIDESGTPGKSKLPARKTVNCLAFCAGVLLEWKALPQFVDRHTRLVSECFRPNLPEIKGASLLNDLAPGVDEAAALKRIAAMVGDSNLRIWVTGCELGCDPHPRYPGAGKKPAVIARNLLVDRVNGMAKSPAYSDYSWLFVCDLSSGGDLAQFGTTVASFRDALVGRARAHSIHAEVLGGDSRRWPAIQIADVYAFYARHAFGVKRGLAGASVSKGEAFVDFLYPTLQRSATKSVVGWATWPSKIGVSTGVLKTPTYTQLHKFWKL